MALKYKIGDRVKYDSEICTVTKVLESQGKFKYRVQSDTWFDIVEDEMIEGLAEEETKSENGLLDEYEEALVYHDYIPGGWTIAKSFDNEYIIPYWFVDFCNKNHLDYRGLIEKGLAIDATGLNIY